MFGKRRVYLDWAAATPLHPEVAAAMHRAEKLFGNPSAPHAEGRAAYEALEAARTEVARSLSVKPDELTFTSGGTEANNLAICGLIEALHARGRRYEDMHVITSTIEHSSVGKTVALLERGGVIVTRLAPRASGIIDPERVAEAVADHTVLVTLAHVNSEIGVIQRIADIRRSLSAHRHVFIHADCAQSPLSLDASPHALLTHLATYDAQKIMGPKGVGVLWRDPSVPLVAIYGGGGQERTLRPGTENVPGIVGAAVAFRLAKEGRAERAKKMGELRDLLIDLVGKEVPEAQLVGDRKRRIANNACFALPGVDGDYLAVLMDKAGIAVTPRSACLGPGGSVSEVVLAVTLDERLARGTIRFSLGPSTTKAEIRDAVRALKVMHSRALTK